ncbi:ribose-phosphate diphosphokinase [Methylocystis heyeri]|nr:ribose-phosphate pyrophosphokinase [Methylocystis heyeri]
MALALFCLDEDKSFAAEVSRFLGVGIAPHEERAFEDGEFKIRPLSNVRNRDVYVLASLHGAEPHTSVSEKLCRLLFFIGALKDAGAAEVCLAAPYLCYQRKDRQTKPRDPVTSRYLAQLLEAMGTHRVITMDAHNVAAYQNAFRCDTDHLDARGLFASHFARLAGDQPVAVVSPDLGGEKRAELFRERLERKLGSPVDKAFMDKRRSQGEVTGDIFAGEVDGRIAIVLDDLISGGGTMARVAQACKTRGATQVWCAATHGVFSSGAAKTLGGAPIDRIVVTDTVPLPAFMTALKDRLSVVGAARLFAQAIERCHNGGSLSQLIEDES